MKAIFVLGFLGLFASRAEACQTSDECRGGRVCNFMHQCMANPLPRACGSDVDCLGVEVCNLGSCQSSEADSPLNSLGAQGLTKDRNLVRWCQTGFDCDLGTMCIGASASRKGVCR